MHPEPSSNPPDLERISADLKLNEVAIHEVMGGLSESELGWQPDNGTAWSILQCVDHLAFTNRAYTAAMGSVVRDPGSATFLRKEPIRPSALGSIFLKRLEPPVEFKVPAPKATIPPGGKNKTQVIEAILESHEEIRGLVKEAFHLDLNRLRFRNPFLPVLRVRVGTALLIITAHERRHLWQAQRIRAAISERQS